ncbi:MAG: SDR family oxidoreductase [Planctomycetota bacterium]
MVTGASRGIGRAISVALARAGADLTLVARSREALEAVRREIEGLGVRALSISADLADPAAPGRVISETVRAFRQLDILINNAGAVAAGSIAETSAETFDSLIAVNARAPFLLCREALAHLAKSPAASIINISSVVGHKGYPNQSAYAASKHALMGFTKVLAAELHPLGIRVHAISPGGVATSLIEQVRPDLDPRELIRPEEIADLVIFLLTHRGNAMIDEVRVRRASSEPSF